MEKFEGAMIRSARRTRERFPVWVRNEERESSFVVKRGPTGGVAIHTL